MGNTLTQEAAVSLSHLPDVVNRSYNVIRTSGERERGWVISKSSNWYGLKVPAWVYQHALKSPQGWRIFMHNNGTDINTFQCGWRRLDTIAPTDLNNDEAAITKWRLSMSQVLDELEKIKKSKLN